MIKGSLYSWTSHPIPIIHEYKPLTITIYLNNHQHPRQVILTTFLISAAIVGYCLAMKPLVLPKDWALIHTSLREKFYEAWVVLPNKWSNSQAHISYSHSILVDFKKRLGHEDWGQINRTLSPATAMAENKNQLFVWDCSKGTFHTDR